MGTSGHCYNRCSGGGGGPMAISAAAATARAATTFSAETAMRRAIDGGR